MKLNIGKIKLIKMEADLDWMRVLVIFVIFLTVSVSWNVYFFFLTKQKVENSSIFEAATSINSFAEKEVKIDGLIDEYSKKELKTEVIKSGGVRVLGDPSIF